MSGRCDLVMISESVNSEMTIGIGLIRFGIMIGIDKMGIDVCSFCNPALQSLSSYDSCNSSAMESGWLFFGTIALRKSFSFSFSSDSSMPMS